MIGLIKNWVLGMTAAGLIAAVLTTLAPKGKMRRVTKLTASFLLVAAMIGPAVDFDFTTFSSALTDYRAMSGEYTDEFENENDRLMRAIIEERSAAYISDKAVSLGISPITITVTTKIPEEGGYPCPYEIGINADCTQSQKTALSRYIEGELGVPLERQYWSSADGT